MSVAFDRAAAPLYSIMALCDAVIRAGNVRKGEGCVGAIRHARLGKRERSATTGIATISPSISPISLLLLPTRRRRAGGVSMRSACGKTWYVAAYQQYSGAAASRPQAAAYGGARGIITRQLWGGGARQLFAAQTAASASARWRRRAGDA